MPRRCGYNEEMGSHSTIRRLWITACAVVLSPPGLAIVKRMLGGQQVTQEAAVSANANGMELMAGWQISPIDPS